MVYHSIIVKLYRAKKIKDQYLIANVYNNDSMIVFRKRDNGRIWMQLSQRTSAEILDIYNNNWKYGRKDDSGRVYDGFTPVTHKKRELAPKVYHGASVIVKSTPCTTIDTSIFHTYKLTKEDYVTHC